MSMDTYTLLTLGTEEQEAITEGHILKWKTQASWKQAGKVCLEEGKGFRQSLPLQSFLGIPVRIYTNIDTPNS